ncbi:hypothetical protein K4K97_04950 [Phaeobacter inhibens]|uniref:hypothetical protein n=1 Tax=Phaeobacter inhibens TaxID=221822 RepID=UPI0021A77981|nr:hypothetical protein [Phaeobacter inhibens]UWR81288.1 hypothetical protein K4K97_04950 [Phaeobacter inhibens]UWS01228.1 hypothetical protein K4L03_05130 [Phaeobacter inhibens]
MKQPILSVVTVMTFALGSVAMPVSADGELYPFDIDGFLSACTEFVQDVDYALPMDTQCVSQAVRMCNLSQEMKALQHCADSAAAWLAADGARIVSLMPGFDKSVLDGSGPAGLSLPIPTLGDAPDCTQVSDHNLPAEVACRYSEALSEWLKLRILMRSEEMTGEASQ